MKESLLISACLCGELCKYNGGHNLISTFDQLKEKYNLIYICPESDGGLSTPRNPSEIKGQKVFMNDGRDVTKEYQQGASIALARAKEFYCTKALLKEKSPSCGVHYIYDGTFSGKKISGSGITTKLLNENGITVYSELEVNKLL